MKLNHLGLPSRNVQEHQTFYCRYFGFRVARGDGFLINDDDFIVILDPATEPAAHSEGLHYGFYSPSHAETRALHERLREDGVEITVPLSEGNGMLTFFCRDPEGYTIEVRSFERQDARRK
ncbi:MAG: Glyoxalase/bleomycin resistance protein/dioxygenase [Rhodospirillales bacterium]|nr:Glyoxalase/bleomycin resistance protein/dioxygenase [Rhodospirillales bacterium]